jgi:ubiquinone/menaquinone biosynthesis C-methylase UbiE
VNFRKSDYESYDYSKFWEDDRRLYEDRAERLALRRLLAGIEGENKLFFDIGCGYGRLFNEYKDFGTIVLIDYSLNNLKNARNRIERFLKNNPEKLLSIHFIAADATSLPIKSSCADVILTVRVVHHLDNPEKYFNEVARVLKHGGLYFLEFANKRNLKNILRSFAGRMDTSPFNLMPSQIGETILNFHPKYITSLLEKRNFTIRKSVSVSNFRLGLLKRFPGTKTLIFLEKIYQKFFSFTLLGPSIFLKSILNKSVSESIGRDRKMNFEDFLICTSCGDVDLIFNEDVIKCRNCGNTFIKENGIYNFKVSD